MLARMANFDSKFDSQNVTLETLTAQALGHIEPETKAVIPPIHMATTFEREPNLDYPAGYSYSREGNPTYRTAEDLLTRLEGGRDCMLMSSGMAALTSLLTALPPRSHIVAPEYFYYGMRQWLEEWARPWGMDIDYLPNNDVAQLERLVRQGHTQLVLLETPANPIWTISDIARAADIAHACGARLAVDSTAATPVVTRPLSLGADIVVHSATKFLNGHSDVVAGALVTARDDEYWQRLRFVRTEFGAVPGPMQAWLLVRGMRTLFLRVRKMSDNALAIARHFYGHPRLRAVLYPGLESHPGHDIARKQMIGGFGGMMSIRLAGGRDAAVAMQARLRVFTRATSLGGIESLVEHRQSVEVDSPTPADLLRLSIGIENVNDLIADLEQALAQITT